MDNDAEEKLLEEAPQPSRNSQQVPREDINGIVFWLLKWPLFMLLMSLLLLDLWLYFLLRQFVRAYEAIFGRLESKRIKKLRVQMKEAASYEEWKSTAMLLDELLENSKWIEEPTSTLYNFRLISQLTKSMTKERTEFMQDRSVNRLKQLKKVILDGSLRHNVGGIENIGLYSHCYYGTKTNVQDYVDETEEGIKVIEEYGEQLVGKEAVFSFYKKAVASFGRSVLCLSGGGACGYYHLGVVRALGKANLLPQVICGTSAGAAVGALVCTHTDEELAQILLAHEPTDEFYETIAQIFQFSNDSTLQWLKRFFTKGHLMDVDEAAAKVKVICGGDLTFAEAYQKTGRILNITITTDDEASPPQLLNYKVTPDVVIYTAVLASASLPGLLPSVQLLRRRSSIVLASPMIQDEVSPISLEDKEPFEMLGSRWRDGSFVIDIPLDHLRPLFNIKFSLVSQVNPGVALFFYDSRGAPGQPHLHRRGHGFRAGFLTSLAEIALKLDMKRYLELLGGLSLMPRFLKQDWSLVLLQRRDGTVTIVPSTNVWDIGRLLSVPTGDRIKTYIETGERATWPMLKMFENRLKIERRLVNQLNKLKLNKTSDKKH